MRSFEGVMNFQEACLKQAHCQALRAMKYAFWGLVMCQVFWVCRPTTKSEEIPERLTWREIVECLLTVLDCTTSQKKVALQRLALSKCRATATIPFGCFDKSLTNIQLLKHSGKNNQHKHNMCGPVPDSHAWMPRGQKVSPYHWGRRKTVFWCGRS